MITPDFKIKINKPNKYRRDNIFSLIKKEK